MILIHVCICSLDRRGVCRPLKLILRVMKHRTRKKYTGEPRPKTTKNIVVRETHIFVVDTYRI